jgi:hypothetical protein
MRIRHRFVGVIVGALVVFALAPVAAAQAAFGPPEIISITPNQCGSAGLCKVIIRGAHFEEISRIELGVVPLRIVSGTPAKGQCKVKSSTEIECIIGAHEHGTVCLKITNPFGTAEKCLEFTFLPEVYRNEIGIGAAHVTLLGYGQITLTSPQIATTMECVNLGFGSTWNENQIGHGEVLSWTAAGHAPREEHTELSSKCRFIYHGIEENGPTSPIAWASPEPPLKLVNQEGIVCAEAPKEELGACPLEAERIHETVTREVSREPLNLPWNAELTERAGAVRTVIGLPEECKSKTFNELSECPEASEREPSKSPEGCNIPRTPDPPGCVKVQILSAPPLNVHMVYEGYLEPMSVNAGPNGLSPSNWEFEGHEKGEPGLRLRETPSTEGSITGFIKILGYAGQELITMK